MIHHVLETIIINKEYYLNGKGLRHIFLVQLNPLSTSLHFCRDLLVFLLKVCRLQPFCWYISVFFSLYQILRMLRYKHSKSSTCPRFPFLHIKLKRISFSHNMSLKGIKLPSYFAINLHEYNCLPSILLERGCICHSDEVKPLSPLCRWVWKGLGLLEFFLSLCNAFGSLSVTNSKMQRGIFRLIFIMDPATDDTFCPIEMYTISWKCQYIIYKNTACEIVP